MTVFRHHLYEYDKGLRRLVLHTAPESNRLEMETILRKQGVAYLFVPLSNGHVNVFFGDKDCVDVVKSFGTTRLSDLTDEQDFMLGIMLGYDRQVQCRRYLARRRKKRLFPLGSGRIKNARALQK
ncbi:DUF2023 family protein, partial [Jonquetella sp. BV3C21]